ncbi:MAG: [protein-PII] uridylyltransferase, partial [Polyangiaceae bacterium]|nr:[protein-PII] uridylyltransferase [Polyangiaceae bacterium]
MKPPNANLAGTGTDIRTKLGAFTQTVETAFAKGEFGKSLAAARCALFDDLFRSLLPKQEGDSCVVAIGGYGRRMLALGSDLDLRWIFDRESDRARLQSQAETVLYPLWDLKVTVGHHLLSLDEALEQGRQDISTATSLLDVRLLAGDPTMVRAMDDRVWGGLFSERYLSDFVERLEAELEGRHKRFGDSVFLLEPDVKNGTGGHRDLDAARWVARARYAVPHEDMWSQLVRVGALLEREAREISQAEEFLWKVRNSLHRAAGRRSDRLTFDGQELLSRELGYIEGEGISARSAAVERLMQDYYRHARSVRRVREKLFERAKPTKRTSSQQTDVGDGFYRFDAFIACRSTTALQETPSLALHALEKCVDHEARLWPSLREQIQQLAGDPVWCASLRNDPETPARFVALVSTSRETKFPRGSVISELLEIGLVLAVIPEFEPVTGRV